MLYLAVFLAGGIITVALGWLWEVMTAQRYGPLIRELDEQRAVRENEKLLKEVLQQPMVPLDRGEIWSRMAFLWKETRGWVLRHGGFLAFVCLGLFAFLYFVAWFKTLIRPNARNLRLLVGGRSLVLHAAQKRRQPVE